jgi:hypothetical protein
VLGGWRLAHQTCTGKALAATRVILTQELRGFPSPQRSLLKARLLGLQPRSIESDGGVHHSDHWLSRPCPSSGILNTGPVSVFG